MKIFPICTAGLMTILLAFSSINAVENALPDEIQKIMLQKKYDHAIWGIYAKDLHNGNILYDLNGDMLFSPASTTKLFSIAALLNAFGDTYRFETPVYADGKIKDGHLQGNLILVGQGDLTMGGRQANTDQISYTKMDHIIANEVAGTILTKEDPLQGIKNLAKQVSKSGIKEVTGDILIDDRLFEITHKREMTLSPIMINENLIDLVINPTELDKTASILWRPGIEGYTVENQVKTVAKDGVLAIEVTSDETGHNIVLKGTIPLEQQDVVRTSTIKEPASYARQAFIEALIAEGIKLNLPADQSKSKAKLPADYKDLQGVALWTSPPLSEYAKLILKVSHNLGADLVPLLLASQQGKKTFDEGMLLIGDFVTKEVGLSEDEFVFVDAAGGNENRLTPKAEIQLLEYINKQDPAYFKLYFDALPILGVDGSLEDFGKDSPAVGKVRAKTGTGVALNLATGKFFLITQALAGYIEGSNGNLIAFNIVVNNGSLPTINDIFAIFEDVSQLAGQIYVHTAAAKPEILDEKQVEAKQTDVKPEAAVEIAPKTEPEVEKKQP